MTTLVEPIQFVMMPVDGEHAAMMDYARSTEGMAKISGAMAEIDAGRMIVADDAYFTNLKARIEALPDKR